MDGGSPLVVNITAQLLLAIIFTCGLDTSDGMPEVHDSAEKRQFFSSVEVFDVNTGCWEQRTTSGTPPLGVQGCSCVAVRNELHYFGGYCGHDRLLPQQCSHTEHLHPAMEDVGSLNNRRWGTNAEVKVWNGALH